MPFNGYAFLLFLLPASLLGFHGIARGSRRLAMTWLAAVSLAAYAWAGWQVLLLLVGSVAGNWLLARFHAPTPDRPQGRRAGLVLAVTANLGLLVWCKYGGFIAGLFAPDAARPTALLPLAISFYTFQQISFQVDAWRGRAGDLSPLRYLLFVTFFPQLANGPIVRHRGFVEQLDELPRGLRADHLAPGLTLLAIGLFKKVIVADVLAESANAVFGAVHRLNDPANRVLVEAGVLAPPTFLAAWGATLAYAAQIYFDFSGYSDMARGLARCFGIRLPLNFLSPYKARSVSEFWRRWHVSLSRFLRDYLYIPLGGSRCAPWRVHLNLFLTMLLGGIWHGVGWGFAIWGALHGLYLMINHAWRATPLARAWEGCPIWARGAQFMTLLAVALAWVFFRSPDLADATTMLKGMAGMNGVSVSGRLEGVLGWLGGLGLRFEGTGDLPGKAMGQLLAAWLVILIAPASVQLFRDVRPCLAELPYGTRWRLRWQPRVLWALVAAVLFLVSILNLADVKGFVYDVF